VTKQRNQLALRALGIGISSAVLALACGSDNKPTDAETTPPRETCADNALLAECQKDVPPVVNNNPDQGTVTPPGGNTTPPPDTTKKPSDARSLAEAAAENVLNSNCGSCHGPTLSTTDAQAGMNYINDINALVKAGKIVPLSSATSLVVQRMINGSMPPLVSGKAKVTDSDINVVASFIDNPVFWPDYKPVDCSTKNQIATLDDVYRAVNRDLATQDSRDTPFLRYISLTNRFTAGVCADTALDKDRQAMLKMMNMLSTRASIGKVTPINPNNTIYVVDERDFNWNRQITVGNQTFNDVWDAIAGTNNPYAVELFGDDADRAKQDTATTVPVMFADQMMDVATIGNLYYAIINLDVNQTLGDFILNGLGVDVQADLDDRKEIRAGTTKSRITRQDRVVERHDLGNRAGVLWESFDFEANNANQSIFQDPFGFAAGGKEAIFTLPNGMLAFAIADANDKLVQDSDILLDTSQDNYKAVTSVSCSNCHALGFIQVVDEVRDVALANRLSIGLSRDQIEQLNDIYVTPAVFQKQVQQDSTGFYQNALQLAALPTQGSDPVASVWLRFDADISLKDAAGDLGVTPADLADSLGLLDPVLSVLRKGTLDRDDFTAKYLASLCRLSTSLENQPDPNVCDAALQAIGQ